MDLELREICPGLTFKMRIPGQVPQALAPLFTFLGGSRQDVWDDDEGERPLKSLESLIKPPHLTFDSQLLTHNSICPYRHNRAHISYPKVPI